MAATVPQDSRKLPGILLLALWFALASGLIEGGYRMFQKLVQHRLILMPLDVVWMAPVANLIWIGVPAVLLILLRKALPRVVTPQITIWILATIGFLPLVLLPTSLHKLVALFLALALGFQASRLAVSHAEGFGRLVRRSVVPLAILVVLAGGGLAGIRAWREHKAMSALPAPDPARPNVLLLIWDTVRGQSLSVYGHDKPTTPYLEQFGREGTRFEIALATAPWTLPSHGSMFTGHRPRDLMQSIYRPLVDTFPILSEMLAARGYATGGFVANLAYASREHGLDRGFARYNDYPTTLGSILLTSRLGKVLSDNNRFRTLTGNWEQWNRRSAADINRSFLDWASAQQGRPFFAFLNYFDAHQPYIPPPEYAARFVRDRGGKYHPHLFHLKAADLGEDEIQWLAENYDASIAYIDDQVRLLMAELERRGMLDNTLVIVSSDHGEHLGDHKRVGHMNSVYRTLLQVPLLMRLPGKVPAGQVVPEAVSLRDLPQTVFSITGIPDTAGFPGTSLTRFWDGTLPDSSGPEPILSELATRRGRGPFSLVLGDYHYVAWQGQDRPEELYHLRDDPWETTKLGERPELAEVLRNFHGLSEFYMGKQVFVKRDAPAEPDDEGTVPQ
jgi:arylsulfatase A-like enzyme